MGGKFLQWSVLGVAAVLVLQPARAGERETAAAQFHHLGASIHRVALVTPAQSNLRADLAKPNHYEVTNRRGQFGGNLSSPAQRGISFLSWSPPGPYPPS